MTTYDQLRIWIISPSSDSGVSLILRVRTSYEKTVDRQNDSTTYHLRPCSRSISICHCYRNPHELRDSVYWTDPNATIKPTVEVLYDHVDTLKFLRRAEILPHLPGHGHLCDRFVANDCELVSLVGIPPELEINELEVSKNKLTDLAGLPKRIGSLNADDNPALARFNCDVDEIISHCSLRKTNITDLSGIDTQIRKIGSLILSNMTAFWVMPTGLMDLFKVIQTSYTPTHRRLRLVLNWDSAGTSSNNTTSLGRLTAIIGREVITAVVDKYIVDNYLIDEISPEMLKRLDEYRKLTDDMDEIWKSGSNHRTQLLQLQRKFIEGGFHMAL